MAEEATKKQTAELKSLLQETLIPQSDGNMSPAENDTESLADKVEKVDLSNGELDANQKKKNTSARESDIKAAFSAIDMDGNGFISAQELQDFLTNLGKPLSDQEISELIHEIDGNGDGVVSYEEFEKMLKEEK